MKSYPELPGAFEVSLMCAYHMGNIVPEFCISSFMRESKYDF